MSVSTWKGFLKGKMGPYMEEYGSHGAAMKQLGKEWKKYKEEETSPKKTSGKKNVRSHLRRNSNPPSAWMVAMISGIRKSSDVRNPAKIVQNIWKRLSAGKQAEIRRRDAAGEQFQYDLPLPDDHPTRGPEGTVRVVDPFNLAEVQVNVSPRHYKALQKSKMFQRMKRNDGSIALVKRCKSTKGNCNIFIDKVK